MVGIASGAYSSIFIASPLLAILLEREEQFRGRRSDARVAAAKLAPEPVAVGAAVSADGGPEPAARTSGPAPRRRRRKPHGRAR
jgi:hypothetical protein